VVETNAEKPGDIVLSVKTPEEVLRLIQGFPFKTPSAAAVPLSDALGRVLAEDIISGEFVPDFNRSTVDGYAVRAADTFGSSESIPAILPVSGEVNMGETAPNALQPGTCVSVPTGGDVPDGADAVVMLEYTESYGDGTIGVTKPVAPGENMIFRGDDAAPGKIIIKAGRRLAPHDLGALAALGVTRIPVRHKPIVAIVSTGDELVDFCAKPQKGQIRDVNSALLSALVQGSGCVPTCYGIIPDEAALLEATVLDAVRDCDMVLVSGGSSVGAKDATARVIAQNGEVLLHGIAMKPGKPTILGVIDSKPVFGLPGHPVAAYFVAQLIIRPAIARLLGTDDAVHTVTARLGSAVSSNHGRAEYLGVRLLDTPGLPTAVPLHGKSGLIVTLTESDGYMVIPRDCEGLSKGTEIPITLWQ
jgi:molybdopterin molybdotransferase